MNKQELASKIWQSANRMRSKIEANEYKNYILGFIFYKFLSEKEEKFLDEQGINKENISDEFSLKNLDSKSVEFIQENIGYFIPYEYLFSTWLNDDRNFEAAYVIDAINSFNKYIYPKNRKIFNKIFDELSSGIAKLGDDARKTTKTVLELMYLIDPIPMDSKQNYDVLGFIYEYLIGMFAANGGKKAGEFYTPHEVSLIMSELVADHLKDREGIIRIYDPTSGSGSLLINIGQAIKKFLKDNQVIHYYAQELKEHAFSITRMNLIMRGINPEYIYARNADTLQDDWPMFDKELGIEYEQLLVDAVVSNPPYSQSWDQNIHPRFEEYGYAPKSKADYAFLLHDLYHLNAEGILTIVLPHGVLFRGGEEEKIRRKLIEKCAIDTIIGLPANVFYGTGIPTIIMVLKKRRDTNDILFVDASKHFIKDGKNNKLRQSDIKRIVDTVTKRKEIDKYSRIVPFDEIVSNDYNLNIARYVDSNDKPVSFDIYASMLGGIPNSEIDELEEYWKTFKTLKEVLFVPKNSNYSNFKVDDIRNTILNNDSVISFKNNFSNSFNNFSLFLSEKLINDDILTFNIEQIKQEISDEIFRIIKESLLIDEYDGYQILADKWNEIQTDLEIIQSEGMESILKVVPNYVVKNEDGISVEKQEGWKGNVLPFELVYEQRFKKEFHDLKDKEQRQADINGSITSLIEELSDEDKETLSSDKVITNGKVNSNQLQSYVKKNCSSEIDEDCLEYKVLTLSKLILEENSLAKHIKNEQKGLADKVINYMKNEMTTQEALSLLKYKWIATLCNLILELPNKVINEFILKINNLKQKYEKTILDIDDEIVKTGQLLSEMIDELDANPFDKEGLNAFKKLLKDQ